MPADPLTPEQIPATVNAVLSAQPVVDMHTHLYPPASARRCPNATGRTDPTGLLLWGVDELLTYHYLVAEVYRVVPADEAAVRAVLEDEQAAAGRPHLEAPVRRAHADLRGLPRRPHDAPRSSGLDPTDATLDPLREMVRRAGPERLHRPGDGAVQRRVDHDDQPRLRRQRARPLAGEPDRSAPTRASRPSCASTRCSATGRDAAKKLTEWGYDVDARTIDAEHDRGGPAVPARLDRPAEGDLPGGQPAAGVPLSRPTRDDRVAARRADDAREGRPARLRRAQPALRDDDRLASCG